MKQSASPTIIVENASVQKTHTLSLNAHTTLAVVQGNSYRIVDSHGHSLANVVAVRDGDNLVLLYSDETRLTLKDFFKAVAEESCQVELTGENGEVFIVDANTEGVALEDGTELLYAHGDAHSLMAMVRNNRAVFDAFSASMGEGITGLVTWSPDASGGGSSSTGGLFFGGIAAAAVAVSSSGGSSSGSADPEDTQSPQASVSADTVTNADQVVVQSTELGTGYLVHESVTVNSLSDITAAADDLWNSTEITQANCIGQ